MDTPLVSIIIPVYNGSNYICEAIDSALAQTYKNIEIIVVNDGSSDNTEEICLGYGEQIRYFKKENGGVSTALNLGIEQMKGEYFSWLSHDDMYYPEKVEIQMEALYKCGDMKRIVYGGRNLLEEGVGIKVSRPISELYTMEELCDSAFPVINWAIGGCALLIHKSHFDRVGLFNTKLLYIQDYEMWFRMLMGQKLIYVDKPLYICRIHTERGQQVFKQAVKIEESKLLLDMACTLPHEEATRMFGSLYEFYRKIYIRQLPYGDDHATQAVLKLLLAEEKPEAILMRTEHLKQFILDKSGGVKRPICIFCAGIHGLRLYAELSMCGINVDYFADNDQRKQGVIGMEKTPCLSFGQLLAIKDDTLVIVANRFTEAIMKQLSDEGFSFVTTKQNIDVILENYNDAEN